jgi:D-ribulokinase
VGAALIDAHAGGVGTIGGLDDTGESVDATRRLGYIMGTSACIMATTRQPCFVPGVWGPYYSAMVPGCWLNEGGQSAAGTAIEFLVAGNAAHNEAAADAKAAGLSLLDHLEARIVTRVGTLSQAAILARNTHVLPDFLGNRSPFADPDVRGAIVGLGLDRDLESLERLYVAGLCGIGYAFADVVDAFRAVGISCETVIMSGGASRSSLVRQLIADATGLTIAAPGTTEPVLLGAAMLGAVASGAYGSLHEAMPAMSRVAGVVRPTGEAVATFHRAKRQVFSRLRALDREVRALMTP